MASRFPPDWLDELRARADIVSIASEHVQLKQNGRNYIGLCPFHTEKTPSFHVRPEQRAFHCFGCGVGGGVIDFVMRAERMEFRDAVQYLADKVRLPLPETVDLAAYERQRTQRERIYAVNKRTAQIFHELLYQPEGARILEYFHRRGLDDPAIRLFGLGAAPSGWDTLTARLLSEGVSTEELTLAGVTVEKEGKRFDMFRGRAIFPIINAHGAVLGFGGRAMGDAQPKYLNTADTPAFNKRMTVYAHNLLKKAKNLPRVLLVEGYMDVASLVAHGVQGVVATLGTALTEEQAKLMRGYAPEIWVAYDGDAAGQKATMRALEIFDALEIPSRVLMFPNGQDPDDFIRAEGREAFDALTPLTAPQYRMLRAKEAQDLSTEEGRTKYAIDAAAVLRAVRQPVERENLLNRLMVETGFPREVLQQQIGLISLEKPTYTQAVKREKLPSTLNQFLPDGLMAERMLLTLMASGVAPPTVAEPERFQDENHRQIARLLLTGKPPGELLDDCEDESLKSVMLEVFRQEPRLYGDEAPKVITDCLERMRKSWVEARLKALRESIATAPSDEKRAVMMEIIKLNEESVRLRPGRKE